MGHVEACCLLWLIRNNQRPRKWLIQSQNSLLIDQRLFVSLFLFFRFLFYVHKCFPCIYVCVLPMCPGAGEAKRALDPLKLDFNPGNWTGVLPRNSWTLTLSITAPPFVRLGLSICINLATQNSLGRPGWPQPHRDPPASDSRVLGLKLCATTFLFCFVLFLRQGLTL